MGGGVKFLGICYGRQELSVLAKKGRARVQCSTWTSLGTPTIGTHKEGRIMAGHADYNLPTYYGSTCHPLYVHICAYISNELPFVAMFSVPILRAGGLRVVHLMVPAGILLARSAVISTENSLCSITALEKRKDYLIFLCFMIYGRIWTHGG